MSPSEIIWLGNINQTFFLSPKQTIGGWIMGAGPVLLYPSATENALGGQKWVAGPAAVLLKQKDGWTYGALANHIISFAGSDNRPHISATYLQPFLSYTTKTHTTFALNTESTYDWQSSQWTVSVNAMVAQLVKIDKLPVQFQLGARYYPEKPTGGADWGVRFAVTLLFPK